MRARAEKKGSGRWVGDLKGEARKTKNQRLVSVEMLRGGRDLTGIKGTLSKTAYTGYEEDVSTKHLNKKKQKKEIKGRRGRWKRSLLSGSKTACY